MEMFIGCIIGIAATVLCGYLNTIGEDTNDKRRGDRVRTEEITVHGHRERH